MRTARLTKIAMVIFLSMIFFLGVQKPVLAAGKNTTVKIPVEQIFEVNNSAGADKTGSYVLIADQIQNPMPEGSNRRTFTWNMSGNSSTELIMNVGQAGEYHYKLYQATENKYLNPVQATSNGNTAVMKQRIEAARGDVIELKITNENTQLIPETGVRLETSRHVWLLFAISIIMILFFRRRRKIR